MRGFPKTFKTRTDIDHGVAFCKQHPEYKMQMIAFLTELRDNDQIQQRKASSLGKKDEELTDDDFEYVYDVRCEKVIIGITNDEIDFIVKELAQ